jgi:hypothetical protein
MQTVIQTGLPPLTRVAAWGCIVALAVLSWLPADHMIRTGFDGRIEHFVAYMLTMICLAGAYASRLPFLALAAMLIGYAGILELGQHLSPGRHPAVLDFAASLSGALVGALLFEAARQLLRLRGPEG